MESIPAGRHVVRLKTEELEKKAGLKKVEKKRVDEPYVGKYTRPFHFRLEYT